MAGTDLDTHRAPTAAPLTLNKRVSESPGWALGIREDPMPGKARLGQGLPCSRVADTTAVWRAQHRSPVLKGASVCLSPIARKPRTASLITDEKKKTQIQQLR